MIGHDMGETLSKKFGWGTSTCAAEKRIDAAHKKIALS